VRISADIWLGAGHTLGIPHMAYGRMAVWLAVPRIHNLLIGLRPDCEPWGFAEWNREPPARGLPCTWHLTSVFAGLYFLFDGLWSLWPFARHVFNNLFMRQFGLCKFFTPKTNKSGTEQTTMVGKTNWTRTARGQIERVVVLLGGVPLRNFWAWESWGAFAAGLAGGRQGGPSGSTRWVPGSRPILPGARYYGTSFSLRGPCLFGIL